MVTVFIDVLLTCRGLQDCVAIYWAGMIGLTLVASVYITRSACLTFKFELSRELVVYHRYSSGCFRRLHMEPVSAVESMDRTPLPDPEDAPEPVAPMDPDTVQSDTKGGRAQSFSTPSISMWDGQSHGLGRFNW